MPRSEVFKELKTISERIFNLESKLSDYIQALHGQSSEEIDKIKEDLAVIKERLEIEEVEG